MAEAGYEQQRKKLTGERENIQKKTFTKWINSFLKGSNVHVHDLFSDLSDGRILIRFLEIISSEKLGPVARGRLRIHKLENVNRALDFLKSKKVKLESIGAEDIVDGNARLTLGLMWTMILRFDIQDVYLEDESPDRRSAKEGLLVWCQRMTQGYPGVRVDNFTTSWRDGLAFNAIIHRHRPDLFEFNDLKSSQADKNLRNAFDVASNELGIARLLDPEDVNIIRPDDKSIMTQLVAYYKYFTRMKSEETSQKRIIKMVGMIQEGEDLERDFDVMMDDLMAWMKAKIAELTQRNLPNTLEGIQQLMTAFTRYRTEEKPPKYVERSNIELQLFDVQSQRRATKRKMFMPPEGRMMLDLNSVWAKLEQVEHEREMVLRDELMRQEKLEQLAAKFVRKVTLRQGWLHDMEQVLEDMGRKVEMSSVDASLKRYEAISAGIMAGEGRIITLMDMAEELVSERYHDSSTIQQCAGNVKREWERLKVHLDALQSALADTRELTMIFKEMDELMKEMVLLEATFKGDDLGKHLTGVTDLLEKHGIAESGVSLHAERCKQLIAQSQKFVDTEDEKDVATINILQKQQALQAACDSLLSSSSTRRARLEASHSLQQFLSSVQEEEVWMKEAEQLATMANTGHDLNSTRHLLAKHKTLEAETAGHESRVHSLASTAKQLCNDGHYANKTITQRSQQLQDKWQRLKQLSAARRQRLEEAVQAQQYYADSNEAEYWMKEKEQLASSDDYGHDEISVQSLLHGHERLEEAVKVYATEITRLKEHSRKLVSNLVASEVDGPGQSLLQSPSAEGPAEMVDVEVEYEEDETVTEDVEVETVEELSIPQVQAMYKYEGKNYSAAKGEVLVLVSKANKDWWSVRNGKGKEGFVPANYVRDTAPQVVKKPVKKVEKVTKTVKVKKKRMEKQKAPSSSSRKTSFPGTSTSTSSLATGSRRSGGLSTFSSAANVVSGARRIGASPRRPATLLGKGDSRYDSHAITSRQQAINATFDRLVQQIEVRRKALEDALRLFSLYRECDDVESWMKDKEIVFQNEEGSEGGEHVEAMKKTFDNFVIELAAHSVRVMDINNLADQFVRAGHTQSRAIRRRQQQLNDRWEALQRLKASREQVIEVAQSVQQFQQTCDETKAWIAEKEQALATDDCGKDLDSVKKLQRKHQAIVRELAPVEEKLDKLKEQAEQVVKAHPRDSTRIRAKQAEIQTTWQKVKAKAEGRWDQLNDALDLQHFYADSRDLLAWADETKSTLNSNDLPRDVQSAEEAIDKHQDLKADIDAHNEKFDTLLSLGKRMLTASVNAPDVRDYMKRLTAQRAALQTDWAARNEQLKATLDMQLFNREAEQLDGLTSSQEAFLANEDLGTTVDSAEALLKKHEEFEGQVAAQEERYRSLYNQADCLVQAGHYDSVKIAARRDAVSSRREKVKEASIARHELLSDAVDLQNFLRDADECTNWMTEKMQTASDESYRETTNLEAKLKKHEAFDAEVATNKAGIDATVATGEELLSGNHYSPTDISIRVEQLTQQWDGLAESSSKKGQRLQEALAESQFNRALDDAHMWLRDCEVLLASSDLGKDLGSVQHLLKKHQLMEADIGVREKQMQQLGEMANALLASNHFNADNIQAKHVEVAERFSNLHEPVADRRSQLEDSQRYHQFHRNAEDELAWLREHMTIASSTAYGGSLTGVHNLIKKMQAFEVEIGNHQPRMDIVLGDGEELLTTSQVAADDIQSQLKLLRQEWAQLEKQTAHRVEMLEHSLESQKYYSESTEADTWMNEKAALAANQDVGKDEDSDEKNLTRHKALELDVEAYISVIDQLGQESQRLVSSGHFDAPAIGACQAQLEEQLEGLQTLVAARRGRLEETKKLHQFMREANEVASWIADQLATASSTDYGKDFEHLQVLLKKFNDFKQSVQSQSESFKACNALARRLVAEGHSDTVAIKERQDSLRASWQMLQEAITARSKRLAGAHEIHKFIANTTDLLSRIHEKHAIVPEDDLGRDVATVEALQRKHEGFENEIAALGTQVQGMIQEAGRLEASFPGSSAQQIRSLQTDVSTSWEALQALCAARRLKLRDSLELQRLLGSVRDMLSWITDMSSIISSDSPAGNVQGAEEELSKHSQVRAEIDAREETMSSLVRAGDRLIAQQHYAADEIRDRLSDLALARDALLVDWQEKQRALQTQLDVQTFNRDVQQADAMNSGIELFLTNDELGNTVDEVETLIKKHEAYEMLVAGQEEKVAAVEQFAARLATYDGVDQDSIQAPLEEVLERRDRCKAALASRRERLEEAHRLAQFQRDLAEWKAWIGEKMQTATDESYLELTNLPAKLKKHEAFEAELSANETLLDSVGKAGEALISAGHYATAEVETSLDGLFAEWEKLKTATAQRGRLLAEAQDLVQFKRQADIIMLWMKEKELVVTSDETGDDLEHCADLQKRFDDFEKELVADRARVDDVSALADTLLDQNHSSSADIEELRQKVLEGWDELLTLTRTHKDLLADANKIHQYNRSVDDCNERIQEKVLGLSSDDYGKDLAAVEVMQRHHDDLERDLTVLAALLESIDNEAKALSSDQVQLASVVDSKLLTLVENWEKLNEAADTRKSKLGESHQFHTFLNNIRDLMAWIEELCNRINNSELAKDITEAEEMLEQHQQTKVEIDARDERVQAVKEFGETLITNDHMLSSEVRSHLDQLEDGHAKLLEAWQDKAEQFTQCYDLQVFLRDVEHVDAWIGNQEAFLSQGDLGDSMDRAEALLKKHDDFEKTLDAQREKVDSVNTLAEALVGDNHYDAKNVSLRQSAVVERFTKLQDLAQLRRDKLNSSYQLQQFLRDTHEMEMWIVGKLQTASDESYRDPTNLLAKLQKHQAFEAELTANRARVDMIAKTCTTLVDEGHYASDEMETAVDYLQQQWDLLSEKSSDKASKLQEAWQQRLFNRNCEDIERWLDETEQALASEDIGKDLPSVNELLKNYQLLESDVAAHQDRVDDISAQARTFHDNGHFQIEQIEDKSRALVEKYCNLEIPLARRRKQLDDSLCLYLFYRDLADEAAWVREREPIASSSDLGQNLLGVQKLSKTHATLEAELVSHEPLLLNVGNRANELIRDEHFAATTVEERWKTLQESWSHLKEMAVDRRAKLNDSLEAHEYYTAAHETEVWMSEKRPLVASEDYGRDEDSAESLLKKNATTQQDVSVYGPNIDRLQEECNRLITADHFDSTNLQEKQGLVKSQFNELQELASQRMHRLEESRELHIYNREVDEVEAWIDEKEVIATLEDYGKDLEHVVLLQQKHEDFSTELSAGEKRVIAVEQLATSLCDGGHSDSGAILQRLDALKQHWKDTNEYTQLRRESLAGAKQIHTFDHDADETRTWIQEKEAAVSSEDYGRDLASVQALKRKHEGFERDIAALEERVHILDKECQRLVSTFPDSSDRLASKQSELAALWQQLKELTASRKTRLEESEQLHRYLNTFRDLNSWIDEMLNLIKSDNLARDVTSAEALLTRHREHRAEIDARETGFSTFVSDGAEMIGRKHFASDEIREKIDTLAAAKSVLLSLWEDRQQQYEHCLDTQQFIKEAQQAGAWIALREAFLANEELGASLEEVEELLKKQDDFEKTLAAQVEKFSGLNRETAIENEERQQLEAEQRKREVQRKEAEERKRQAEEEKKRRTAALRAKQDEERRQKEEEQRKAEEEKARQLKVEERKRQEAERKLQAELELKRQQIKAEQERKEKAAAAATAALLVEKKRKENDDVLPASTVTGIPGEKKTPGRVAVLPAGTSPDAALSTTASKQAISPVSPLSSSLSDKRLSSDSTDSKPGHRSSSGLDSSTERSASPIAHQPASSTANTHPPTVAVTPANKDHANKVTILSWECEGVLQRKNELDEGGRKSAARSWKAYYTVLSGQLLHFFKDKREFQQRNPSAPAINITGGHCEAATDYTKRKNVLRLKLHNGAEYLFLANDGAERQQWVSKLQMMAAQGKTDSDGDDDDLPAVSPGRFSAALASPSSPTTPVTPLSASLPASAYLSHQHQQQQQQQQHRSASPQHRSISPLAESLPSTSPLSAGGPGGGPGGGGSAGGASDTQRHSHDSPSSLRPSMDTGSSPMSHVPPPSAAPAAGSTAPGVSRGGTSPLQHTPSQSHAQPPPSSAASATAGSSAASGSQWPSTTQVASSAPPATAAAAEAGTPADGGKPGVVDVAALALDSRKKKGRLGSIFGRKDKK